MKKITLLFILAVMVMLTGCKMTVAPKDELAKSPIDLLTEDVAALKQSLTDLKQVAGSNVAVNTADIEQLRQEQAVMFGNFEDRSYEIEGLKENLRLLSDTIENFETRMNEALPDSRIKVFKNSSHLPMWEEPEAYFETLLDFLDGQRG